MGIVFRYIKEELSFYFNINDPIGGILAIFIIISFILALILVAKTIIEINRMKRKNKEENRKIDKMWLNVLKGKDKNKEQKNY